VDNHCNLKNALIMGASLPTSVGRQQIMQRLVEIREL